MEIRVLSATATECEVVVDGQVTLLFRDLPEKGVWKVGAYCGPDSRINVPKPVFLEARRQARCAIRSKQNEGRTEGLKRRVAENGVTANDAEYARTWGARFTQYEPWQIATEWLIQNGIWTREREKKLRSLLGHHGGTKAAEARRMRRGVEATQSARRAQMRFPFL